VLTSAGLNSVLEKYTTPNTGAVLVHGKDQPVLPATVSDVPLEEAVKVRLCRSASASCSRDQYREDKIKSSASAERGRHGINYSGLEIGVWFILSFRP